MGAMSSSSSKDEQGSNSNDSSDSGSDSSQHSSQPYHPTIADTALVRTYLMHALQQPAELADLILEYAGYGPRIESTMLDRFVASAKLTQSRITTKLSPEQRIALRSRTGVDRVSVTTMYDGPDNSLAALCLVTEPVPGGRWAGECVKVVKVRFWMRSRDQGWGGSAGWRATYRGSYSWFEAVIIRPIPPKNSSQPDTVTNNEDIYTTTTEDKPDNHNHTHNSDSESLKITTPSPRFPDPASLEAHYLEPRGYQLVPRVHCSKERKRKKKDEEVYKSWTVQHNLVAVAQAREHEVEWWDDDTDDDDNNNGDEAENDKDDETGKGSGRGFVKALRPGDKVGVLVRAMYPGWSNQVENLKIDIETCVRY